MIKKKIIISLMIICFICIALNSTYAANETQKICLSSQELHSSNILSNENTKTCEIITHEKINHTSSMAKTIEITQDNYDIYFNARTGKLHDDSEISSGDVLKIGNISNRAFVIDRQLTIMPISQGDVISNGFIHLVKGSDGSTVTNLIINNTEASLTVSGITVGRLHGIWLSNSNNNLISYNTIRIANSGGVYAMPMGWSSNNRIIYNDMKTYITSNMIMGQCHYNLISHNSLEVLSYSDLSVTNLIYFNPFGHADYSGSPLCLGNIISYNYLKGFCNMPMSIILQMTYDSHDGTVIANNTIIKGSFGVNLNGNNVSVYGNIVNNSDIGINVAGANFTVNNNLVTGDSQSKGIVAVGLSENAKHEVKNNNITFTDVSHGLQIGNYVVAHNNIINLKGYGVGIYLVGDKSNVYRNTIYNSHDPAISMLGSFNLIDSNVLTSNKYGIAIPAQGNGNMYFNNSIIRNKISSDNYGIYITGLVYSTIIRDNNIITNASIGIFKQITDEESNTEEDNIVNGIILKSTAFVIDDNNFFKYFDNNGYFKYELGENKVIILTFLTNKNLIFKDKVKLISNKRNNLLYNVTITLKEGADESLVEGFYFINYGKNAILIENVSNVTISQNNITEIFKKDSLNTNPILIHGICDNLIIKENNIYVNSKLDYSCAILANGTNSRLSSNASIKENNIIMISSGACEAVYTDMFSNSKFISNKINIISDDYSNGMVFVGLNDKSSGLNVSLNEIIIHSKQMVNLIKFHMIENSTISNNTLYSESNGVYGIKVFMSDNISITNNTVSAFGENMNKIVETVNAAIAIIKNSNNTLVQDNLIHTDVKNPILLIDITDDCIVNKSINSHVLDDKNYNVYFDIYGNLYDNVIGENDCLLIYNLTKNQILKINRKITISSYDINIPVTVKIILDENASESRVNSISFLNSIINLNNVSNIIISNNSFLDSILIINSSENNAFIDNIIVIDSMSGNAINIINSKGFVIESNSFKIDSKDINVINIVDSNLTVVTNNTFDSLAKNSILINSINTNFDVIANNSFNATSESSVMIYYGFNVKNGEIINNFIFISAAQLAAIYFDGQSSSNNVLENRIISFSKNANDYAVMIKSDKNLSNSIIKNYLISSNGLKIANDAVYAPFDIVHSNTPADVYVSSVNGSDIEGDGSVEKPYKSISKAIINALNHSTIHIYDGTYFESNIIIDKDLYIVSINPGKVIIDANQSQLFTIDKSCELFISGVLIRNAHNEIGGSVFINNGKLTIDNSVICNSSSFHDNSHPIWENITYESNGEINRAYTHDYSDTGLGGAIFNNGDLLISQSMFDGNLGHWGGAIADYGKTTILSSIFSNNLGVHGGVIFTNSKNPMTIKESFFKNNAALTSLDYCALRMVTTAWSIDVGNIHKIESDCNLPIGYGGVIFTNSSLLIENSEFLDNSAKYGGVIAAVADSSSTQSNYVSKIDLQIINSTFINNRANDTRRSIGELNLDGFPYNSGFDGGVVYGSFNKFYVSDSKFYDNQAIGDGGAISAQANDGQIFDSIFTGNIAGISGGALDLSKNFIIMRTIISNNSARYGGAIQYSSYTYYGHIQDNFNIYNSTISNNKALNRGGAFDFGSGNIVIHDSNIVNNVAPAGSTLHSSGGSYTMDMRYNYWGTNDKGRIGPDDSVWAVSNNQFRPWYKELIKWDSKISGPEVSNDDGNGNGQINNDNNDKSINTNPKSTGSSISTGKSIGGSGNGNGGYNGNGGSNLGYGGIGNGHNGPYSSFLGSNSYKGQNIKGNANKNTHSPDVDSQVDGDVDKDSLSRSNSSSYNPNLASVGSTSNAASAASSSQGGSDGASDSLKGESVSKSFEIKEIEDLISDDQSFAIFLIFAFVVLLLLVIGYRRYGKDNQEY